MNSEEKTFKEQLEEAHAFPGPYTFKFIVKPEQQQLVEGLVEDAEIKLKPSSGSKYLSITMKALVKSSDQVLEIYRQAKKIDGIISL